MFHIIACLCVRILYSKYLKIETLRTSFITQSGIFLSVSQIPLTLSSISLNINFIFFPPLSNVILRVIANTPQKNACMPMFPCYQGDCNLQCISLGYPCGHSDIQGKINSVCCCCQLPPPH